jgi:hypothetical protein
VSANLSFEQAPAISVPFRFLVTAPWFGVAAGLLAAWTGEQALATRWSPTALALTHLLALGFMLQAMIGAMLQFVPVAAGGNVWRPLVVANVVHPLTVAGALLLVTGFMSGNPPLLRFAAALLLTAIAFLVTVVGAALLRTPARGATLMALRLAIASLGVTAVLGSGLAEGLAGAHSWPLVELTDVHAAWGLGAWSLTLLMGVSYFVVPMFQLTPQYPVRTAWVLPMTMMALVVVWSLRLVGLGGMQMVWLGGLGTAAVYAFVTLGLQYRRRRRVTDPTLWFFRVSMVCLLALLVSAAGFIAIPGLGDSPRTAWWLGVLVMPGAFVSAINGMMYKIVPFLNWLHLQRLIGLGGTPPNMKDMIPERQLWWQLRVHLAALVTLLAATFRPGLVLVGGTLFALSCAWLGANLMRAVRVYAGVKDRIAAGAAHPVP